MTQSVRREDLKKYTVGELCDFLEIRGCAEDVVLAVRRNGVNGDVFLELTEEHLKELAPLLGDRIALKKIHSSFCKSPLQEKDTNHANPEHTEVPSKNSNPSSNRSSSDWHKTLQMPSGFSTRTVDCISTGIITHAARTEIVQTLAMLIWTHTHYPSPDQYNVVCAKLVEVYLTLADDQEPGWKLRDRMKFLRRPPSGSRTQNDGPPHKRAKSTRTLAQPEDDPEEYEAALRTIQQECSKKKKNTGEILTLMEKTFQRRRFWILSESPHVSSILRAFPGLKMAKPLRQEFRMILQLDGRLNSLLDNWPVWRKRIIEYAKLEGRNRDSVKRLLSFLESEDMDEREDYEGVICLELLCELLIARNKKHEKVVHLITDDEDIEQVIEDNPQIVPYLLVIKSRETMSYCVVVEKQPFMEPSTFSHAFVALVAAYYVFNISYSKGAYSPCIMIQRYIFGITDEQPLPKNVREAVTTMKNLLND